MRLEDLTPDDISSIIRGEHAEYPKSNFLGRGADGVVYVNPNDNTRAVKFQIGTEKAYKNEIDNLFEAQLKELDTPAIYESGFTPIYETESGYSYIDQDKLDFDRPQDEGYQDSYKSKFRKAQALSRLYNAGINHADTHGGNIRYNSATDTPSIIDFSRAKPLDTGIYGINIRDRNVADGLVAAGDQDIFKNYKGIADELSQKAYGSGDPEDIKRYRDFVDAGEGSLEKIEYIPLPNDSPASNDSQRLKPRTKVSSIKPPDSVRSLRKADIIPSKPYVASPLKGAFSVGAADLIPSRETIRMAGNKGIVPALQNHGKEFALSMPYAAGVGMTAMAVPAVGTAATLAAPGLITVAAGEAADEAVTQATGEGIISKIQQTIGTKPRTGIASPGGSIEERNKRKMDRVFNPPEIKPMTGPPLRRSLKNSPAPELGRRLRLAGERFNPSKGEFGITELLFGR